MIPLFLFVCVMVLFRVKEGSLFFLCPGLLLKDKYLYVLLDKTVFKTVLEAPFLLGFGQSE